MHSDPRRTFLKCIALTAAVLLYGGCEGASEPGLSDLTPIRPAVSTADGFEVDVFAADLDLPTSIAFPPDGSDRLFVNELQSGKIVVFEGGVRRSEPFVQVHTNVSGGFPVAGENGLLGIAFDSDYETNRFVYVTYVYRTGEQLLGRVVRYTDSGNRGTDRTVLLDGIPSAPGHQIQSLAFGPDDRLYVSVGDAYLDDRAQDSTDVLGKILRLNRDGSIPDDNPFPGSPVYALGFRNCFDLVFMPNGDLITTCNGPEWNDEMEVVEKGANYGWPHFTGRGETTGYVDPIHVWSDVVSPTGMLVYRGSQFPERYRGKLLQVLFGSTHSQGPSSVAKRVQVIDLSDSGPDAVATFEDLLVYEFEDRGNPLDIAEGPDGSVYVSDIFKGRIYRIRFTG